MAAAAFMRHPYYALQNKWDSFSSKTCPLWCICRTSCQFVSCTEMWKSRRLDCNPLWSPRGSYDGNFKNRGDSDDGRCYLSSCTEDEHTSRRQLEAKNSYTTHAPLEKENATPIEPEFPPTTKIIACTPITVLLGDRAVAHSRMNVVICNEAPRSRISHES